MRKGNRQVGKQIDPIHRIDHGELLALAEQLYDIAMLSSGWDAFLDKIHTLYNSELSYFQQFNYQTKEVQIETSTHFCKESLQSYRSEYAHQNLWIQHFKHSETGKIILSQDYIANQTLESSSFYQDWLRVHNFYYCMAAIVSNDQTDLRISVGLLRSKKQGPYERKHKRVLHFLMPHLQRALKLHRYIQSLRLERRALSDAFDQTSYGLCIVNASCTIQYVNAAGESILREEDGLYQKAGKLRCSDFATQQHIEKQVFQSAHRTPGHFEENYEVIHVQRPSFQREYCMYMYPVHPEAQRYTSDPVSILFIFDPERMLYTPPLAFQKTYGLTQAEAQIGIMLLNGLHLKEIAERRGVSVSTVRHQLKQIFQKTMTNSQTELLSLFFRSILPTHALQKLHIDPLKHTTQ